MEDIVIPECPVCTLGFIERKNDGVYPCVGTCGHSVCSDCVKDMVKKVADAKCPVCRREHAFTLDENKTPKNYQLSSALEALKKAMDFVKKLASGDNSKVSIMSLSSVPDLVIKGILLYLDDNSLKKCFKVCHTFHNIILEDSFWIERAAHIGIADVLPTKTWILAARNDVFPKLDSVNTKHFRFDYRCLVMSGKGYRPQKVYNITRRTTINSLAREQGVQISHGGNGVQIERHGHGSEEHPEVEYCFATSFSLSSVTAFVNLKEWGIDDWVMDYVRPRLRIRQLAAPRNDCGSRYIMIAHLSSLTHPRCRIANDNYLEKFRRINKTELEWPQWSGGHWSESVLEISDYPKGMRNLSVTTYGVDKQFWAGHYGSKFANLTLEVILPDDIRLLPEDAFVEAEPLEEYSDNSPVLPGYDEFHAF